MGFYGENDPYAQRFPPYNVGNSVSPAKIAFENALIFFSEWARPESGGVDSDILQALKDTK
jgi:hypothetical protein